MSAYTITDAEKKTIYAAADILLGALAEDGDKITVRGLGTFKRKLRPARTARNPSTGAPVNVPASLVLRFTASPTSALPAK